MGRRPLLALLLVAALTASCGGNGDEDEEPAPGQGDSIDVSGTARLDGKPFDSDFVGAVVLSEDGLVTPCQGALPPVKAGRFTIPILTEAGGTGCGAAGAKVVLWTFAADRIHYSTSSFDWPDGDTATFDPSFDTTNPQGASPEVAQFSGEVYDEDGSLADVGTEVEALVGDTTCGVASVRRSDDFVGYVLSVVGPEAVEGCTRDVVLTFTVDGRPAEHNPVANRVPGVREPVDLRR